MTADHFEAYMNARSTRKCNTLKCAPFHTDNLLNVKNVENGVKVIKNVKTRVFLKDKMRFQRSEQICLKRFVCLATCSFIFHVFDYIVWFRAAVCGAIKCDERSSHPRYVRGILKVLNIAWKIGMSYDAVGCASRRETSPEPLVPEIDGVD